MMASLDQEEPLGETPYWIQISVGVFAFFVALLTAYLGGSTVGFVVLLALIVASFLAELYNGVLADMILKRSSEVEDNINWRYL